MCLDIKNLLLGSIQHLAHVNRYTSYPVSRRENVAEHTCFVSLYCLLIGEDLECNVSIDINWRKLLKSALLHDLDEALTGDFLRSVKYGTPGLKKALDTASVRVVEGMESELNLTGILDTWKSAKDDSLEGSILAIADFLAVASYVVNEIWTGNRHLYYILHELRDHLVGLGNKARSYLPSSEECEAREILQGHVNSCIEILDSSWDDIKDRLLPPRISFNDK